MFINNFLQALEKNCSFGFFGLEFFGSAKTKCAICAVGFPFSNANKIFSFFTFFVSSVSALHLTICIRIVADFESRIFQFTTNIIADYNVHIYCYLGYYFYTLLCLVVILCSNIQLLYPIQGLYLLNNRLRIFLFQYLVEFHIQQILFHLDKCLFLCKLLPYHLLVI